jgi:hypothetical protein
MLPQHNANKLPRANTMMQQRKFFHTRKQVGLYTGPLSFIHHTLIHQIHNSTKNRQKCFHSNYKMIH